MQDFDYAAPQSLDEAVALAAGGGSVAVLAGGTDLIVQLRVRRRAASLVIDAKRIPELTQLAFSHEGLNLGAAVTCRTIGQHPEAARRYPALADSVSLVGGVQIQGRASVGGNLCNAAPSADCIPALIVLNADAIIAGPFGRRELKVEEFCLSPGITALRPGEILVALRFRPPAANAGSSYMRFTPRKEMDIAVAGAAAAVVLDESRERILSARVALAAVAPTPLLVEAADSVLAGRTASDESAVREAAAIARDACSPINDMRGTSEHRRQLVEVLTVRALHKAIERARNGTNHA